MNPDDYYDTQDDWLCGATMSWALILSPADLLHNNRSLKIRPPFVRMRPSSLRKEA